MKRDGYIANDAVSDLRETKGGFPRRFQAILKTIDEKTSIFETNKTRKIKEFRKKEYSGEDRKDFLKDAKTVLGFFDHGFKPEEVGAMKLPRVLDEIEVLLDPEKEKASRSQIEKIVFMDYVDDMTQDEYNSLSKKDKDNAIKDIASELTDEDCEGKTVGFALKALAKMLGLKY